MADETIARQVSDVTDERLISIPPAAARVWKGDFTIFNGPFLEADDEDQHTYQRGVPLEICGEDEFDPAHLLQREVSPLLSSVRALLAVLLSGAMGAAWAQVDVPDKQDAPPIELPELVVEGKATAADGPLLPSELQVEGPFGDSRPVAETPRAVTSISSDLIERAALVDLSDLQRLVPNSYGANTFGAASLPSFRGQLAEIFQDGLRRQGGNNGLGLPLSLNGVGQIDAIKGPPPASCSDPRSASVASST